MSIVQLSIDQGTARRLISLGAERGVLPAELVAEIVSEYLDVHLPGSIGSEAADLGDVPPDAIDDLVGKYSGDRNNDIDDVVYGAPEDLRVGPTAGASHVSDTDVDRIVYRR